MNVKQHALAAEIRAEAAAQQVTAKHLQEATGVSSSAWSNYFRLCTRDVPMGVVVAVADELGLAASELMRRAEVRAAGAAQAIKADLSPEAAAQVAAAEEHIRGRRVSGTGSAKRSKTG